MQLRAFETAGERIRIDTILCGVVTTFEIAEGAVKRIQEVVKRGTYGVSVRRMRCPASNRHTP